MQYYLLHDIITDITIFDLIYIFNVFNVFNTFKIGICIGAFIQFKMWRIKIYFDGEIFGIM